MKVSVVMPTYNQLSRLKLSLKSIVLSAVNFNVEIIVVNDGSEDGTKEYLESLLLTNLKVINQNNSGRSRARNQGLKRASGDLVILVDSDIIVDNTFIADHIQAQTALQGVYLSKIDNIPWENFEKVKSIYEVSGQIKNVENLVEMDPLVNMADYFYTWTGDNKISWPCFVAGAVSIAGELLKDIWFDVDFSGWGVEDHEFGYQLKSTGASFWYLKNTHCFHLDCKKQHIVLHQLLENILVFAKKYPDDKEIKEYLAFITGEKDLSSLINITLGKKVEMKEKLLFRPITHLKGKAE